MYVVGLVLIVLGAIPGHINSPLVFGGMYIVAVGTGGIKPNVSTLGADQFDDRYSQDRKEKESFFNWFYWAINLGAMISYTLVAYICQYGVKGIGGEDWGFFDGYLIPCVMMSVAVAVFLIGTPRYVVPKPSGSILATTVKIICEAFSVYFGSLYLYLFNRDRYNDGNKTGEGSGAVHLLDRAKTAFGGSYSTAQVECVKLVTRLTPFLIAMVPYWY